MGVEKIGDSQPIHNTEEVKVPLSNEQKRTNIIAEKHLTKEVTSNAKSLKNRISVTQTVNSMANFLREAIKGS